jgi:lipoyl(octanoyl) transferase
VGALTAGNVLDRPSAARLLPEAGTLPVEWLTSPARVGYTDAIATMEARVAAIADGSERELVWLLEHPPLYTAGTSARASDLLSADRFPVYATGRGGQYTYHGPGQRVAYVMLDLNKRQRDLRFYVRTLEDWIIATLGEFGIAGEWRDGRIGIWVATPSGDAKIAAVGIRIRRWVTFHGVAVNIAPNLDHFSGIVPCGIGDAGVTSLAALGVSASMVEFDAALKRQFATRFGAVG